MHFVLQTPSLQHLAEVKIVAHLWNQRDIRIQIEQTFNGIKYYDIKENPKKGEAIEKKVESKVAALPLPEPCKRKLLCFIKPVGIEMIRWWHYHNVDRYTFKFVDTVIPRPLSWTMHGTVDYAKMAQLMVKDDSLDVESRYEVACINCLEDEARELFQKMGEERRREYVNKVRKSIGGPDHHYLLIYFTCTLTGDARGLNHFFQYASRKRNRIVFEFASSVNRTLFEEALVNGDGATCAFWFAKLNQGEKELVLTDRSLVTFACIHSRASSLLFYLSRMNEEQQRRNNIVQSADVLLSFLRWPMQPLFMELTTKRGTRFKDDRDSTNSVLYDILDKINLGFRDYDYAQLFWECWRLSPVEYKQDFLSSYWFLKQLLLTKREDFIALILNEAPVDQMKRSFDKISQVLMDERVISDAALIECKQTAALKRSEDRDNVELRLRSQHLTRLVDHVMESRTKRRL